MQVIPKARHGSKDWLLARWKDEQGRCVFGASDVPALMGASPYKTRGELFADKVNEPVEQEETAVFRRGNLLEKPLLEEASRILGTNIFTPDVIYRDGRLSISLDGVDNEQQPSVVVEAKTSTRYSIYNAQDLPDEWCWQGWAQMAVLQVPVWFVVLDRDQRISVVELDALAQMMLSNEIGTVDGVQLVSWKQQAGKASLDTKQLRSDHPELVQQYEKQGAPFRVMRITKGKGK